MLWRKYTDENNVAELYPYELRENVQTSIMSARTALADPLSMPCLGAVILGLSTRSAFGLM